MPKRDISAEVMLQRYQALERGFAKGDLVETFDKTLEGCQVITRVFRNEWDRKRDSLS